VKNADIYASQDNCGSITPGVLKAFVFPPLQSNIRALSLGLSYSLTHDDTFQFLNNFPQLEELELRYYWVSAMFTSGSFFSHEEGKKKIAIEGTYFFPFVKPAPQIHRIAR